VRMSCFPLPFWKLVANMDLSVFPPLSAAHSGERMRQKPAGKPSDAC
jgi:hypothetical protein